MRRLKWVSLLVVLLCSASIAAVGIATSERESNPQQEDGQPPRLVRGAYSTTYYAGFGDWDIFPVLLPITNIDPNLIYEDRFDLTEEGQIFGNIRGEVERGDYLINLPANPSNSSWYDTDGDPSTASNVKVFMVGIANGLVQETYVSRYDFLYTRSFVFDPNTRLWSGQLLVWAAEPDATLPILNGEDNTFYTQDDIIIRVPQGWSIVDIFFNENTGREGVRVYQESEPNVRLLEPLQLQDVDLSELSYAEAFNTLLDELERTYVFTDYRAVDWEALRQEFGPIAEQITNDVEFQALLENTLFSFPDGHLAIIGPGIPSWFWGRLGLQVFPVDGELMVIQTLDPSPITNDTNITPGTVLLTVNGIDAIEYFDTIPQTIYSGGNDTQTTWRRGGLTFRGEPGTNYDLEYRLPNGTVESISIVTAPINEIGSDTFAANAPTAPLMYDILPSGVGIIDIRNFTSANVDDLWDDAMNLMTSQSVDGIVIDLRNNGGGFSSIANYMFGSFLDEDIYAGREISALDEDGDGQIDVREEYYYARGQVYDPSKVVVLVGPNCFSACEFAAYGFQEIGATVVGHLTSGGAGGGVGATYFLPGGTQVYGMGVVLSEDTEGNVIIEGVGVPLDVQVPYDAAGLLTGEDLVLQAAEQLLLNN